MINESAAATWLQDADRSHLLCLNAAITCSESEILNWEKNANLMPGNQQFLLILLNTGVCFLLARQGRNGSSRRERQRMVTQWGRGLQNVSSCFWPDGNSSSLQSKAYLRAIRTSKCGGCVCFKGESVLFCFGCYNIHSETVNLTNLSILLTSLCVFNHMQAWHAGKFRQIWSFILFKMAK